MEFAVIEFPGVVKNSENAVKMLGGMIAIASVRQRIFHSTPASS
jgi:hypothetical protein